MALFPSQKTGSKRQFTYVLLGPVDDAGAAALKEYLDLQPGVFSADINLANRTLKATIIGSTEPWEVEAWAAEAGFAVDGIKTPLSTMWGKLEVALLPVTMVATIISFLGAYYGFLAGNESLLLGAFLTFICGYPVIRKALFSIMERKIDLTILNGVAIMGPLYYSLYTGAQFYYAAGVLVFFLLAVYVFEAALASRYQNAGFFLPGVALVSRGDKEEWVKVDEVNEGDTVIVKPGFRVPVDGIVAKGEGKATPVLPGCSEPITIKEGVTVEAGSIMEGSAALKASKKDPKIKPIASAFKEARKPVEVPLGYPKSIEKALLLVSLFGATFVFALIGSIDGAISILLLGTPVAMMLSRPAALLIGKAVSGGRIDRHTVLERMSMSETVLINGADALLDAVVVSDIIPVTGHTEDEVRSALASYAPDSPDALLNMALPPEARVKESPFRISTLAGATKAGNFSKDVHARASAMESAGKAVRFALKDKELLGIIGLELKLPEGTKRAVERLEKIGVKNVTLLSSESTAVTDAIARNAGIKASNSRMDWREKISFIQKAQSDDRSVLVVGKECAATTLAGNGGTIAIGGPIKGFEWLEDARAASFMEVPGILALSKRTFKYIGQSMTFALYFNTVTIIAASIMASVVMADIQIALLAMITSVAAVATSAARLYVTGMR